MTFKSANPNSCASKTGPGFTLVEVLVAVMFMAIVVPVALGAMRAAGTAGEASQRKLVAARIATSQINSLKVQNLLQNGGQSGVVQENGVVYRWSVRNELWDQAPSTGLTLATVRVDYGVSGHACSVQLSALAPPKQ